MKKFNFIVTNCYEADKVLGSADKGGRPIQWGMSIIDPGKDNDDLVPDTKALVHMVLRFDDIEEEPVEGMPGGSSGSASRVGRKIPPSPGHVDAILSFAKRLELEGRDGDFVLVHCHAGISRSTAALYIVLCHLLGEGKEEQAIDEVYFTRSVANPNTLLVGYGDLLLKRNGLMSGACEDKVAALKGKLHVP